MVVEVEWFSNRSGTVVGTIAKGEGMAGWNYVVLKRDKQGEFHVRKVMGNFFDLEDARVDLRLSMISNKTRLRSPPWISIKASCLKAKERSSMKNPTKEQIRKRAHEIYMRHGKHGRDVQDWLQAERELKRPSEGDEN